MGALGAGGWRGRRPCPPTLARASGAWVGVCVEGRAPTPTQRPWTPTPPTAFERSLVVWSRRCVAGFRGSLLVGSRAEFRCPRPCSRTSRPVLRLVGRALSRRLGVSSSSSRGREHGHAATLFEGICVLCRGLVFHVHVLAVGSRVTRPVRAGARTSRRVSPSDAPGASRRDRRAVRRPGSCDATARPSADSWYEETDPCCPAARGVLRSYLRARVSRGVPPRRTAAWGAVASAYPDRRAAADSHS